jgi:tetratricopeptide (TPR) repeat protein
MCARPGERPALICDQTTAFSVKISRATSQESSMRRPWTWALPSLCLIILLSGFGAWRFVEDRRCRALLTRARAEMSEGRWGSAKTGLVAVLYRRPNWDEALYELGVCELARGRKDAAVQAWGRVPSGSALEGWIEVRRSRIEMERGRFEACKDLLRSAADRTGLHRAEARWGLVLLLRLEGRFVEARDWRRQGFDQMIDPVETLQRLYRLDHDLFPTEGVRQALDRAGRQSPEDVRVWLGTAHLATRLCDFDKAKAWLDRCRERTPDDLAVWRARLDWAIAANRPEDARKCLAHVPARHEDPARPLALPAWFAAQAGDPAAERRAHEHLLCVNPAESAALERLDELLLEAGQQGPATEFRLQKQRIDQARKADQDLLFLAHPLEHAAELGRLAGQLGRWFEARRWVALANRTGYPEAAELDGPDTSTIPHSVMLADVRPEIARSSPRVYGLERASAGPMPRFTDDAEAVGLQFVQENGGASGRRIPRVTSSGGVGLIDIDNHGWLDVYVVQGGRFPPEGGTTWAGDRRFRNRGDGTFEDVTARSGIGALPRGYGHGVAVGDIDNDGRVDALIVSQGDPLAFLRNQSRSEHFLTLRLEGTRSNRDGVGARVTVRSNRRSTVAQRFGAGGSQSACDPRLHFGLGGATPIERIEVNWPTGRFDRYSGVPADGGYLLREGKTTPRALTGWTNSR